MLYAAFSRFAKGKRDLTALTVSLCRVLIASPVTLETVAAMGVTWNISRRGFLQLMFAVLLDVGANAWQRGRPISLIVLLWRLRKPKQ